MSSGVVSKPNASASGSAPPDLTTAVVPRPLDRSPAVPFGLVLSPLDHCSLVFSAVVSPALAVVLEICSLSVLSLLAAGAASGGMGAKPRACASESAADNSGTGAL